MSDHVANVVQQYFFLPYAGVAELTKTVSSGRHHGRIFDGAEGALKGNLWPANLFILCLTPKFQLWLHSCDTVIRRQSRSAGMNFLGSDPSGGSVLPLEVPPPSAPTTDRTTKSSVAQF